MMLKFRNSTFLHFKSLSIWSYEESRKILILLVYPEPDCNLFQFLNNLYLEVRQSGSLIFVLSQKKFLNMYLRLQLVVYKSLCALLPFYILLLFYAKINRGATSWSGFVSRYHDFLGFWGHVEKSALILNPRSRHTSPTYIIRSAKINYNCSLAKLIF